MPIQPITKFLTDDGQEHSSVAMAVQHEANERLRVDIEAQWPALDDAQDVLNFLSGRRSKVREWLDACDELEKEAIRQLK